MNQTTTTDEISNYYVFSFEPRTSITAVFLALVGFHWVAHDKHTNIM